MLVPQSWTRACKNQKSESKSCLSPGIAASRLREARCQGRHLLDSRQTRGGSCPCRRTVQKAGCVLCSSKVHCMIPTTRCCLVSADQEDLAGLNHSHRLPRGRKDILSFWHMINEERQKPVEDRSTPLLSSQPPLPIATRPFTQAVGSRNQTPGEWS